MCFICENCALLMFILGLQFTLWAVILLLFKLNSMFLLLKYIWIYKRLFWAEVCTTMNSFQNCNQLKNLMEDTLNNIITKPVIIPELEQWPDPGRSSSFYFLQWRFHSSIVLKLRILLGHPTTRIPFSLCYVYFTLYDLWLNKNNKVSKKVCASSW